MTSPETASLRTRRELLHLMLEALETGSTERLERHVETLAGGPSGGRPSRDPVAELAEAEPALHEAAGARGLAASAADCARLVRHTEERFLVHVALGLVERGGRQRRAAAIVEAIPQAVLVLDHGLRVRHANSGARRLLRRGSLELVGHRFEEILDPRLLRRLARPEDFVAGTRRIVEQPGIRHEDAFRERGGVVHVRRSLPLGDAGELGCIVVVAPLGQVALAAAG